MFGRLASDRVKSAGVALDEGRFDDAYRVLAAGKGRPTSDVQALRARLADALLTRGQERLLSQKFAEALSDFERAAECGADPARVGQWRGRAEAALNEDRHARRQAQSADEQARVAAAVPVAIEHYRRGRLSQAADTLRQIAGIAEASSERTMIETALRLAQQAAAAVHDDRYSEAQVLVGRIAQLGVEADWLAQCQAQLDELQQRRQALLSGPLGLMAGSVVPAGITMTPDGARLGTGRPVEPPREPAGMAPPVIHAFDVVDRGLAVKNGLPRRMVLRIDGVGAYLILRGDRVTIGRAGPGATADLELFADLSERQAQVIRAGEDYFLGGAHGVELAGRKVEHALLQHDDRIRLGSRVKLRFLRPSAKSVTSLLELGEGVRTNCESRRVVLWGGPLILSPSRDAHVVLPAGVAGVVLLERDGRVLVKPIKGGEAPRAVDLSSPFVVGELRMSLCALDRAASPGRVVG